MTVLAKTSTNLICRVTPSTGRVTRVSSSSQTLISLERRPHFKTCRSLGKNKIIVMGPNGTRNQDLLCWRGSAAMYWAGLDGTKNHSAEKDLQQFISQSVSQ
jgi:hypothetical protein